MSEAKALQGRGMLLRYIGEVSPGSLWRSKERFGAMLICLALITAIILGYLVSDRAHKAALDQQRVQGYGITRVLSSMAYTDLMSNSLRQELFGIISLSMRENKFAYIAITDADGHIVKTDANEQYGVPAVALKLEPANWTGHRELVDPVSLNKVIDFYAPLLENGKHLGFVRVGLGELSSGFYTGDFQFIAMLVLPIFLLVPLIYFPIRWEFQRYREVQEKLDSAVDDAHFGMLDVEVNGTLGTVVSSFNRFIEKSSEHINKLEAEQDRLSLSAKVSDYSSNFVENLLQSCPIGVLAVTATGTISHVNTFFLRVFNVEKADLIGQTPDAWCSIEGVSEFLKSIRRNRALDAGGRTLDFSSPFAPDKQFRMHAVRLPARRNNEKSGSYMVVVQDVTAEVTSAESKAQFISHVSHELKSPLNVLRMYSDSLRDHGDDADFRVEATNIIGDETERLASLIDDLLRLNGFEHGTLKVKRGAVRLSELLQDVCTAQSRHAKKRDVELHLQAPENAPTVLIDKEMFRIAMNNLVNNAIKYNRTGGRVDIDMSLKPGKLTITVKDTGVGINEADANLIFDKFYRSESEEVREQSGHGLGLPITKQIIEMHGGTIVFSSEVGIGSSFELSFGPDSHVVEK